MVQSSWIGVVMEPTKEKQMKDSSIVYLEMRGYEHEEASIIVEQNFKDYCCEVAYERIRSDY